MPGGYKRKSVMFRRHKYGAKRTACHQGHMHDSAFEAGYCNKLAFLCRAEKIRGYTTQKVFELRVSGELICKHKIDFWVERMDGVFEIHEVKGVETADWKLKYKLFKALYPHVDYLIIKRGGVYGREEPDGIGRFRKTSKR